MKNVTHDGLRVKPIVRLLVVPALLLVGFAGIHFAPLVHTTANVISHPQLADTCAATTGHC